MTHSGGPSASESQACDSFSATREKLSTDGAYGGPGQNYLQVIAACALLSSSLRVRVVLMSTSSWKPSLVNLFPHWGGKMRMPIFLRGHCP